MKASLIIVIVLCSQTLFAQNWQEWTRQKKTQIKYLQQQIAANKVYIEFLQKGYAITRNGLNAIQHIKDGDLCLHNDFFGSLKAVNPKIKASKKVSAIIALSVKIIRESNTGLQQARMMNQFTGEELNYCSKVFEDLKKDCLHRIDELFALITNRELMMRDDERIKRIGGLYADVQDKYGFCTSFNNEMKLLAVQRIQVQVEIDLSKRITVVQ